MHHQNRWQRPGQGTAKSPAGSAVPALGPLAPLAAKAVPNAAPASVSKTAALRPKTGRSSLAEAPDEQVELPAVEAGEGRLGAILPLTAIFSASVLFALEVIGDSLAACLGLWGSRLLSIGLVTLLACVAATCLHYERRRLLQAWRKELVRRWRAESRLRTFLGQAHKADSN